MEEAESIIDQLERHRTEAETIRYYVSLGLIVFFGTLAKMAILYMILKGL